MTNNAPIRQNQSKGLVLIIGRTLSLVLGEGLDELLNILSGLLSPGVNAAHAADKKCRGNEQHHKDDRGDYVKD